MNRFNYLLASRRPAFTSRFAVLAIDNRVRGPLAALLVTVLLTATGGLIQLARLCAADQAYARAAMALSALQPAVRNVDAQRARVVRKTLLADYLLGIRRSDFVHANELTWIGNRLPPHTWLGALRYEAGSYSLEGTSDRAAEVGTAMLALHDAAHATTPQLVSLHDDGSAGAARVHYTLRLQTRP
jgi:Tfp pilus assembly protein PilN